MGDHRLPGNQARRTLKPTSQDTTSKSVWKDSSKCFLKHKKEQQLRLPTSVEGQHRLFVKERPDEFRKVGTPSEGLTPRSSIEGTFFPIISRGIRSPVANKNQRKLPEDSGLYHPLLPVQQTRRTFWDDIGMRQNNHLLAPWPRGEENSADILIKMLETPKPNRMLENKWPYWEDHREATKQPTNSGKQSQGKLDLEPHRLPWSCEGNWLHDGKHRRQDMLSSIYYKYIYKGGDDICEWAEPCRDSMQQNDNGYENQPSYEESPAKKTDMPTFDLRYGRKTSKVKDNRFSKQDSNFDIKLQKPQDPHKVTKELRYESPYLKNNQWKALGNEDPVTDSNELELQGENVGNPEITEEAYDPTDWKYFISKDDNSTLSTLEQMFMKKRWGYESSTPASNMSRDYFWIMDTDDDDDDDDDEDEDDNNDEYKEEEKVKEQKKENN